MAKIVNKEKSIVAAEAFKEFMVNRKITGKLAARLLDVNLFYIYQLKANLTPVTLRHVHTLKVRFYQYIVAMGMDLKKELVNEKIIKK